MINNFIELYKSLTKIFWFWFYFIFRIVNFLDVIFFSQRYVSWKLFLLVVKRWEDVSLS